MQNPIESPHLGSPHLGSEELIRLLEHGFDATSRAVALLHLGVGCPDCAEALKALVRRTKVPTTETDDLLALTLRDWIEYQHVPKKLADLAPLYRYWIGRKHFAPLEIHRAVLERSRPLVGEDPDRAIKVCERLMNDLADPELKPVAIGIPALNAAVLTVSARARLKRLDHVACEDELRRSKGELERGSGDPRSKPRCGRPGPSWRRLRVIPIWRWPV